MRKRMLQVVALLVVLLTLAPAAGARAVQLDRNDAIRLAQKEAAGTTQVAATSQVMSSGQWTVTLRQDGAAVNDRIYVMLSDSGRVLEEGWLKNGALRPVQVTRERAVLIAERSAGGAAQVRTAGLLLTENTLVWEITGKGRDGRMWTVMVDAFSGKVTSHKGEIAEPKLITKDRAIAIASAQVKYRPNQVAAQLTQYRGTAAWKVELTRGSGHHIEKDTFYIDAVDGKILNRRNDDKQPVKNISKDQAIAIAKKRVNVPTLVKDAKLDNWQDQDVWIVTLAEERNVWAWHIIVLQADGSFRQQIRL